MLLSAVEYAAVLFGFEEFNVSVGSGSAVATHRLLYSRMIMALQYYTRFVYYSEIYGFFALKSSMQSRSQFLQFLFAIHSPASASSHGFFCLSLFLASKFIQFQLFFKFWSFTPWPIRQLNSGRWKLICFSPNSFQRDFHAFHALLTLLYCLECRFAEISNPILVVQISTSLPMHILQVFPLQFQQIHVVPHNDLLNYRALFIRNLYANFCEICSVIISWREFFCCLGGRMRTHSTVIDLMIQQIQHQRHKPILAVQDQHYGLNFSCIRCCMSSLFWPSKLFSFEF